MKEHNAQNSQDNFEGKKYGGGNSTYQIIKIYHKAIFKKKQFENGLRIDKQIKVTKAQKQLKYIWKLGIK